MSGIVLTEYVRTTLEVEGVSAARCDRILAAMADGYQWHPRNAGELRAAVQIMMDACEKRPAGRAALPFLGEMLREDCLP